MIFLLFSLLLTIHRSASFSFNYNFSDPASDLLNLRLEGDAFFDDDDIIKLTRVSANGNFDVSLGRVTYKNPVLLWDPSTGKNADFTTSFTFTIRYTGIEKRGDGMAFFLIPYPSDMTDRSSQGCLGVFDNCYSPSTMKSNVVAVEFDTYMNDWDPSGSHFGIDVGSISSVAYRNITLISSDNTDTRITSNVSYDSGTKLLTVVVYSDNNAAFGNHSLTANVDLARIMPPEVAVGFSGATGHARYVELHQIFDWHFESTLEPKGMSILRSLGNNRNVMIGLVTCLFLVAGFGSLLCYKMLKIKNRSYREVEMHESIYDELTKQAGPRLFRYDELLTATESFADEQILGRGAFGWVYKGFLTDTKIHVAIKRMGKSYEQGIREFTAEVGIISRLRHKNLVELVGWCHHRKELLLVYEYMPNGSLDTHLYPKNTSTSTKTPTPLLPWSSRVKIALGLGSAISYLHRDWKQCVVHRDVKPSNIMLDSNFNAKLGDFGLARLIDHRMGTQTTNPAGTIGYLAPECFYTGHTSKESDVYSFGIVMLEIACGRPPSGIRPDMSELDGYDKRLVESVWELYGQNRILEAADDRLNGNYDAGQMERVMVVGLWCAHPDDSQRPNIKKAMDVLCFESPLPVLPPQMPVPVYAAAMEHVLVSSRTATTTSTSAGSTVALWAGSFFGSFAGSMSAWLSASDH